MKRSTGRRDEVMRFVFGEQLEDVERKERWR